MPNDSAQFSPCSRELLLSFRFSVKDSEPLSAVLHPYTRGVICARHVLPLRGRLRCDLVCYDGDVSARVRYFRISERVVPQIGLCDVRDFSVHGLDPVAPLGVGATGSRPWTEKSRTWQRPICGTTRSLIRK